MCRLCCLLQLLLPSTFSRGDVCAFFAPLCCFQLTRLQGYMNVYRSRNGEANSQSPFTPLLPFPVTTSLAPPSICGNSAIIYSDALISFLRVWSLQFSWITPIFGVSLCGCVCCEHYRCFYHIFCIVTMNYNAFYGISSRVIISTYNIS